MSAARARTRAKERIGNITLVSLEPQGQVSSKFSDYKRGNPMQAGCAQDTDSARTPHCKLKNPLSLPLVQTWFTFLVSRFTSPPLRVPDHGLERISPLPFPPFPNLTPLLGFSNPGTVLSNEGTSLFSCAIQFTSDCYRRRRCRRHVRGYCGGGVRLRRRDGS
jgi:hypothetical protein